MSKPAPHQRFELKISLGAHSADELISKIHDLETEFCVYGVRCFVSSHLGIVEVIEDPEMTKEQYRKDLEAYVAEKRSRFQAYEEATEQSNEINNAHFEEAYVDGVDL